MFTKIGSHTNYILAFLSVASTYSLLRAEFDNAPMTMTPFHHTYSLTSNVVKNKEL